MHGKTVFLGTMCVTKHLFFYFQRNNDTFSQKKKNIHIAFWTIYWAKEVYIPTPLLIHNIPTTQMIYLHFYLQKHVWEDVYLLKHEIIHIKI